MLLFITILLTILLTYLAIGVTVFIYRNMPYSWSYICMLIFFVYTCHHFGVSWKIISLLYLSVCLFSFIVRALFPLSIKTRYAYSYKTGSSATSPGNNFSLYSNYLHSQQIEEEQPNEIVKFNKLILCALVPLWLIYFLSRKTANHSFKFAGYFYSGTFSIKNKIITFFKNIKAA